MKAQTSSLSGTRSQNDALGDGSEEEEFQKDLQRAIEASKADSHVVSAPKTQTTHGSTPTSSLSTTFLSERAQLEKERLARLKHHRGESDDHKNVGGQSQQPPVKRPNLSSVEPTDRRVNQLQSTSSTSSNSSSSSIHGRFESKTTGIQAVPVIRTALLAWRAPTDCK
ncbi:hypothetical protein J3R83DRAFT_11016 [Lanmaoa asiatica]|nr:hypothetical protein J3R83DRAFT_11016 [Lanmaoa asiatica]